MAEKVLVEEAITEPVGAAKGVKRPVVIEVEEEGKTIIKTILYMTTPSSKAWNATSGSIDVEKPVLQPDIDKTLSDGCDAVDENIKSFRHDDFYAYYETGALPDLDYKGTYITKKL